MNAAERHLNRKTDRAKGLLKEFHEETYPLEEPLLQIALEKRFEKVKARWDSYETDDFSLDDWRTLLAFEMWKDGMEWDDVLDLWQGNNEQYNDRGSILVCLGHTFGYIREVE